MGFWVFRFCSVRSSFSKFREVFIGGWWPELCRG